MPGLHLVDAEQRADLERELGGRLRERRLERDHAAFAEDGLEQHQRGVRRPARVRPRAIRCRSGRANATPGTSGPKPSHFAGCPVAESAPSVRPWKPPSSATIRVRPVALRAILSAASFASAPELQKNACAAFEALGEQRGEPQHRLRPVEVRGMPEPVELLLRGRERTRRTMAETDNGDPGDEVEVLPPGVVPDPAALAAHDREVGPRVGRQHRLAQRRQRLWLRATGALTRPPPWRRSRR